MDCGTNWTVILDLESTLMLTGMEMTMIGKVQVVELSF